MAWNRSGDSSGGRPSIERASIERHGICDNGAILVRKDQTLLFVAEHKNFLKAFVAMLQNTSIPRHISMACSAFSVFENARGLLEKAIDSFKTGFYNARCVFLVASMNDLHI